MTDRDVAKVADLVRNGSDVVTLLREVNDVMVKAVPHYWTPCWYTIDPADWLADEYSGNDVHSLNVVIATGLWPGLCWRTSPMET